MKAVICLLVLCLFFLALIFWVLCKYHDDQLTKIVNMLYDLLGYKHDDIYFKLSQIRDNTEKLAYILDNTEKLVDMKVGEKIEAEPDPSEALIVEPCPICGYIPAMYKHSDIDMYCVRCSGWSRSKYDGACGCSICVMSESKTAAITAWNNAVLDYIMHKNEEV